MLDSFRGESAPVLHIEYVVIEKGKHEKSNKGSNRINDRSKYKLI